MRWLVASTVMAWHTAMAAPPQPVQVDADLRAPVALDGSLEHYVAYALANHPDIHAAYARWQAAMHRVTPAGALDNPSLDFAVYLRSVETRVGPQQARVSLTQAFPWPTALAARRDAAAAEASSAQHTFDAQARAVTAQVERAYWDLWELRTTRHAHAAHLDVVEGLSTTLGARLEVGAATLADLQQVDLSNARLADRIATMDAAERRLTSELRRTLGMTERIALPTSTTPTVALPAEPLSELIVRAETHPSLQAALARTEVATEQARAARATRLPGFAAGADWIATGPMPGVADSGKDAVTGRVSVRIPLWQRAGAEQVRAAESSVAESEALAESVRLDLVAAIEQTVAQLEDSGRRVRVVEDTLLPQAQATYDSLLGSLAVGQGSIAQVLLTQRDLLELTVDAARARADHARAWSTLTDLVGTELPHD